VSIRSDPLDELAIPDGTTVEEHDLVTDGDVIVGGQSTIEFGVRGNNVIAGERVEFGGHIEADGDCRLDMWSDVAKDVLVADDAYLGERVHIGGELKVAGDLDIGDDVDIEDGFEANGWIVIRNPMPTIVFLVVYLSQLLRIGEEEAAEQLATQLMDAQEREHQPVVVPRGARVSDDAWRVSTPATVGDDCRLHGNLRAESLTVGADTVVFGSLRAKEDVAVGEDTEIKGDVTTRAGDVRIERGAHVWGDVSAEDVHLHEHAVVEGTIRVSGELTQIRDALGPEPASAEGATEDETTADEADEAAATADTNAAEANSEADDADGGDETAPSEPDEQADAGSDETDADEADADEADADEPDSEDADDVADTDDAAESEPESESDIESREAVEESLEGVIPMAAGSGERENGHDEGAEIPDIESD